MPYKETAMPYSVTEARTKLITRHVFFSVILYEQCRLVVLTPEDNGMWRGAPVPTACTDGKHIVINEPFWDTLTLDERVFVLAHEVYHAMAMHPRRMKYYLTNGLFGYEFSPGLYNVAADAVINKCLIDDRIGRRPKMGVFLDEVTHEDGRVYQVTGRETPEDVYEYLMRRKKGGGGGNCTGDGKDGPGGSGGSGEGQQAIDRNGGEGKAEQDLREADTKTESEISEPEMKASIQSAANQAKSRGTLPGGLQQFIDDFLEPEVNWEEELRTSIVRSSEPDSYTWSRPNRRKLLSGLYLPRRVGTHCGHVVVSIDTSGSVSDAELRAFLGELSSILSDVRPKELTILWCDSQIDRVDSVDSPEDLLELTRASGVPGRGGTSFVPPFEYIRENIDDAAFHIYMTDGYAPFPDESLAEEPTIWVMSTDVEAPFGTNIHLDISGRA